MLFVLAMIGLALAFAKLPGPHLLGRAGDGRGAGLRAVRVLPAQAFRVSREADAREFDGGSRAGAESGTRLSREAEPAAAAPSALATERLRFILGADAVLYPEVPLADLVRGAGSSREARRDPRALRVQTAPWVVCERANGRVRLVVEPLGGLPPSVASALGSGGVTVWRFERWRRAIEQRERREVRNEFVRAGLALDPAPD